MKKREERTEEEQNRYDIAWHELQKAIQDYWFCPIVNNLCSHDCYCYSGPYMTVDHCFKIIDNKQEYYIVRRAICHHDSMDKGR